MTQTSPKPQRAKRSTTTTAKARSTPIPPETPKLINVALQGGGSHGAFTWGVLDALLQDERVVIEGASGTSAGSMNAVAMAYGLIKGRESAREALHDFWKEVSITGERLNPWAAMQRKMGLNGNPFVDALTGQWMRAITHTFSPYQLNPMGLNPLKDVLKQQIDFEKLNRESVMKLFLAATNVTSGKARVFGVDEPITADMVMASACLPQMFRAEMVNGEAFWDGGFMGNPVLYPLFYHTQSSDVLIVHINPIERSGPPTQAQDILNRVNEITFNASLIKELRAVHFVQKLMDEGWIKDEYMDRMKYVLIHSIRSDDVLRDLTAQSKFSSDWGFLTMLRDRGRASATEWLQSNYDHINVRSTVDLKDEFL